jgi:hypothetical protein
VEIAPLPAHTWQSAALLSCSGQKFYCQPSVLDYELFLLTLDDGFDTDFGKGEEEQ